MTEPEDLGRSNRTPDAWPTPEEFQDQIDRLREVMAFVDRNKVPGRCNLLRTEPCMFGATDDDLMLCELSWDHDGDMHTGLNAEGWRRWWQERPSSFPIVLDLEPEEAGS